MSKRDLCILFINITIKYFIRLPKGRNSVFTWTTCPNGFLFVVHFSVHLRKGGAFFYFYLFSYFFCDFEGCWMLNLNRFFIFILIFCLKIDEIYFIFLSTRMKIVNDDIFLWVKRFEWRVWVILILMNCKNL